MLVIDVEFLTSVLCLSSVGWPQDGVNRILVNFFFQEKKVGPVVYSPESKA